MANVVNAQQNLNTYFGVIPNKFKCGETDRVMTDPVTIKCSHTFERIAISQHDSCPICEVNISGEVLETNIQLKRALEDFVQKTLTHFSGTESLRDELQGQVTTEQLKSTTLENQREIVEQQRDGVHFEIVTERRSKDVHQKSKKVEQRAKEVFQASFSDGVQVLNTEKKSRTERINILEKQNCEFQQRFEVSEKQNIELQQIFEISERSNSCLREEKEIFRKRAEAEKENKDEAQRKHTQRKIDAILPKIEGRKVDKELSKIDIDKAHGSGNKSFAFFGVMNTICLGVIFAEAAPVFVVGAVGIGLANAARGIYGHETSLQKERAAKTEKELSENDIQTYEGELN